MTHLYDKKQGAQAITFRVTEKQRNRETYFCNKLQSNYFGRYCTTHTPFKDKKHQKSQSYHMLCYDSSHSFLRFLCY